LDHLRRQPPPAALAVNNAARVFLYRYRRHFWQAADSAAQTTSPPSPCSYLWLNGSS